MKESSLGKVFQDGENIVVQGETGDSMYVIQEGEAEVLHRLGDNEISLAVLKKDDVFGEMALFERDVRSATVRAKGMARVLTIDKKTFLRRIQEDPSMAFRILEKMSNRIRELNKELSNRSKS